MRIFHLGLCVGPPPFDSMRKAFLANCTDYIELNTGEKDVNQKAISMAKAFKPDIIFMHIQCALIAVDELIIQNGELYLNGLDGTYYREKNNFLFEVKQEIEKL